MEQLKAKATYATKLAIIAFLLHLVWENAQAPLYAGYQSFSRHFPMCLMGAIGDVGITLSVLALVWIFKKDTSWITTDFFMLAIIGFVIAVVIEQHALLTGKWSYALAMPIIPSLKIGLVPAIQMTVLLPLSFYLAKSAKMYK